ncbi:MAG TPA: iron chelate uptake ABC transporter family permease subunit [Acetobacteraceae bacterium]
MGQAGALYFLLLELAVQGLAEQVPPSLWWPALVRPDPASMAQVVAAYSTLPRLAAALLSGAALGLAGALLQQVLRNPLASPGTLGISAGAHLGLAAASLYAPGLVATAGRGLLARPLQVLELPDEAARSLGVPVPLIRLAGLVVAVALGSSVVSLVGVIGFIGPAAPMLARLAGARRHSLAWAPAMGRRCWP